MLLACSLGVFAITQQGILPKLGLQQQLVEAEGLLRAGWGRSGGGGGGQGQRPSHCHTAPHVPHGGCMSMKDAGAGGGRGGGGLWKEGKGL